MIQISNNYLCVNILNKYSLLYIMNYQYKEEKSVIVEPIDGQVIVDKFADEEESVSVEEESVSVEEESALVEESVSVEEESALVEESVSVEEESALVEESVSVEEESAAVEESAAAEETKINILDIEITSENIALNVLVTFINLAQKRGAFDVRESAKIWECIQKFQRKA